MSQDAIRALEDGDIQAYLMDEIMGCSTDAEVAEDFGVSVQRVQRVRKQLARDQRIRTIWSEARACIARTGFRGGPVAMIREALRYYAKAHFKHGAVRPHNANGEAPASSGHVDRRARHSAAQSHAQNGRSRGVRAAETRTGAPGVGSQGAGGRKAPVGDATADG